MPHDENLESSADRLTKKTKHYLITTMGHTSEHASVDDIYRALAYAFREEIMINWLATNSTFKKNDARMLYYLSLEYLPGRIISNTITNTKSLDVVSLVIQKLGRNIGEIMCRESDPGLGNGGLGRLASCFLDSLATLHYPALAYGLRYQYGIFEQQLWDGKQIESPDCWLLTENPWEFRRDVRRVSVKYGGQITTSQNIHGDDIYTLKDFEEVFALPFDFPIVGYSYGSNASVLTLRLWSTKESPRNFQIQSYNVGRLDQASENIVLTDVLYPSDHHDVGKRIRLKQEYLLVSSSIQDIIGNYLTNHTNFRAFADKVRIQINDTHPALIIAELVRVLTKKYDLPWKTAVEITQTVTSYTNHTILSEALEQWDQGLMNYLLPRQTKIIEKINLEFCEKIRKIYPNDEAKIQRMSIIEKGAVRMANLCIVGSHKVNGVAKLHTEILKSTVFKDFYDVFPDKFINITNGVTQRRWLLHANPELSRFITQRIGDGWITNFEEISKLADFDNDPETLQELMQIKRNNKARFIDFINSENKLKDERGVIFETAPMIDIDSLFDVQAKRIHEYKRQLMNALHIIMLYFDILDNPHHERVKRTFIFGGKAAAGYETAKDIIRLINAIARKVNKDPHTRGTIKVVYVENYNVSRAEYIIPAADLSEQISTAGTEASGTGNMKFAINGALTIGTEDGANIEMREAVGDRWWPFRFGALTETIEGMKKINSYNPHAIYEQNLQIKRAVDALRDRTFAQNDHEHHAFSDLFHKLIEGHYGGPPDRYFTLLDLENYYETQKLVDALYLDQEKWARLVIHNIAGMGPFTTDRSIRDYAEKIWGLKPCPIDPEIEDRIRYEYSLVDQCRIY